MTKLRLSFFTLVFLFPVSFLQAEEILLFESDIKPAADGSFAVTETITYDFGTFFRHGITRTISKEHTQAATTWYKKRSFDIEYLEATINGEVVEAEIHDTAHELTLRLGDPDTEITGVQVYSISYRVRGALAYYDHGVTELYWNVTGHNWEVPLQRIVARVHDDSAILIPRRFCYVGSVGETESCESVIATTTHTTFSARSQGPGSGLTIAQELQHGLVDMVIVERFPWWMIAGLVSLGWLGVLAWLVYRYKTQHRPDTSVVSQYEPFEDFKAMYAGVLIDGHLHDRDVTAALLTLAETGWLTIKKTEQKVMLLFEVDDYEVTLERPLSEIDSRFLRKVLGLLFSSDSTVGDTVLLSTLKRNPAKRKENNKELQDLRNQVVEDLAERGYFERALTFTRAIWLVIAAGLASPFLLPVFIGWVGAVAVPLVIIMVGIVIILGFGYQRRTKKGYAALNHLQGFEEFLSVTEKDRLKFHNAPQKSPEQFMTFLPYAVAFGVEKEWSAVFKDIDLKPPTWYEGDGAFNAVGFTSDLSVFSRSFTQTAASQSGSSGGGFSGGGSGGGGGGSW